MLSRTAWFAFASLSTSAFAGNVHVVSPSGPHTQIQSAVDAASDYDTILVKPHPSTSSFYNGFTVTGKSLAIIGDPLPSLPVNVRGEIKVESLPLGGLVVIGSVQGRELSSTGLAFRTVDNDGAVRIEKCTLTGANSAPLAVDRVAFVGVDADTQFLSTTLSDGPAVPAVVAPLYGQTALYSQAAALRLFGCTLFGGAGTTELDEEGGPGGDGGHALQVSEGFAFVADSTLEGGDGAAGAWDKDTCDHGGDGGDGGDGIAVGETPTPAALAQVFTLTSAMQGGSGGIPGAGCSGNGSAGQAGLAVRVHSNGAYQNFANGTARYLSGTPLARTGANVSLTAKGASGDRVYARIEIVDPPNAFPTGGASHSPLGHSLKPRVVFLGTIPPSGTLNATVPAGTLAAGVDAKLWRFHAIFALSSGAVVEANDFTVAVVRSTF